jgi:hypothetical protein
MAGAIVRQTWILTKKTLLVVFWRHWFFTSVRAFWAPIIFVGCLFLDLHEQLLTTTSVDVLHHLR